MSLLDRIASSSALKPLLLQWNQLSQKDRFALKTLIIFFSLFLVYAVVIKPILSFETEHRENYKSRLAFLKEVKSHEPTLLAIQRSGKSTTKTSTSLINRLAKTNKVAIKQISPDKDNQVRATFDNVSATSLLALIEELAQRHSVTVVQASIDRRSAGKINAKLVFGS